MSLSQEGEPIYMAIKGVVFDVTEGKGAEKSTLEQSFFVTSLSNETHALSFCCCF